MSAELQLQSTLEAMSESDSYDDLWNKLFSYMAFCEIGALVYHHLPPPGAPGYKDKHVVKKQFKSTKDDQTDFVDYIFDLKLRKGARVMDHVKHWSAGYKGCYLPSSWAWWPKWMFFSRL